MAWAVTEGTQLDKSVMIQINKRWHVILLRLQQMEKQGEQLVIIEFKEDGPHCRKVGKLEG